LAPQSDFSLGDYYKGFKSLQGLLAIVFCIGPPASAYVIPGVVFPPLGGQTILAQFFTVLFCVAASFLCFLARDISKSRIIKSAVLLFLAAIVFFAVYFGLHFRFVRSIHVSDENRNEVVSVGYERTDFANRTFPGATDSEMINLRGFNEDELTHLWTRESIYVSRIGLYFTFLGAVLSLVAVSSFGVILKLRADLAD
jgi:hypothetical protein